ncbi:hypothetical protein [Paenibacillus piscarius]|uniref:hypothetical protein n=1 Tax=Paenibacillus piscarius TaxID=1089681 RepID=UPI001EE8B335|nr:hypothetical protein [Paenibacillus piscarius]
MKESEKKALLAKRLQMVKKARAAAVRPRRRRIRQVLNNFIVLAINTNNVPYETQGWRATLTRSSGTTVTAQFDEYGVAQFNTISTLTSVSYTLRIFDADNVQQVQRFVPANREFYVARF